MAKAKLFHTVEAIRHQCKRRIPKVAFEYLESGTEKEKVITNNQTQFETLKFIPRYCQGKKTAELKNTFLGQKFNSPIGIAPIGLGGLIWPKAEKHLVNVAIQSKIPFCLSTLATCSPEELDPLGLAPPKLKWFQLYPPKDLKILDSLLARATKNNFSILVVTVDIPAPSRRERTKHAGLNIPLKFSRKLLLDGILHPKWLIQTFIHGIPRLTTVESYTNNNSLRFVSKFVGNRLGGVIDWDYIKLIRSKWNGPILLKGILHPKDALKAKELGCDGVYVSNHGGRQFDGVTSPLKQLMKIRLAVGEKYPLVYDSGIRSGLDILKAIYFGADFVFVGRPFMYGVGAFQKEGAEQVYNILNDQLRNNMMQLGIETVEQIRSLDKDQVDLF